MQNTREFFKITRPLVGKITPPGDKSISHRLLIFAALSKSEVTIKNCLLAQDTMATINCLRYMGVQIKISKSKNEVRVTGIGMQGLREPCTVLDAKNSGTTASLLIGLLIGQKFFAVLTGDTSLTKRPLQRIIEPLGVMGGKIFARENSYLPLAILPNKEGLEGITYTKELTSAQVKSALLFTGLYATSRTTLVEKYPSRDHTERILEHIGVQIKKVKNKIELEPARDINLPARIAVPNDPSSAAFFIVLALLLPKSTLKLIDICINPLRIGFVDVLKSMGAKIKILPKEDLFAEPRADLFIEASTLQGVRVTKDMLPRLIDEIPILTVAALHAEGETRLEGLGALRFKEIDRLEAIFAEFNKFTSEKCVEVREDDLIIHGKGKFVFAEVSSRGDHRMAMALSIMALVSVGGKIHRANCVNISYPTFFDDLASLLH